MDWLGDWIGESGIASHFGSRGPDGRYDDKYQITFEPVPTRRVLPGDGSIVELRNTHGISGDKIRQKTIHQGFAIGVEYPTPVPLETLIDRASDVQDIVSIGTGHPAAYRSVSLQHYDLMTNPRIGRARGEVNFYVQWRNSPAQGESELQPIDTPFSFADLGGVRGLEAWMRVSIANNQTLRRVMATRYAVEMFASDRLFSVAASLERYDKQRNPHFTTKPEINFVERIKRCAAHAGAPFQTIVDDVDNWAEQLKGYRNDVGHEKPVMTSPILPHHFYWLSAYWLYVMCLLRDMDADEDLLKKISLSRENRWLARRLKGL